MRNVEQELFFLWNNSLVMVMLIRETLPDQWYSNQIENHLRIFTRKIKPWILLPKNWRLSYWTIANTSLKIACEIEKRILRTYGMSHK